jgi:hypothetical protein
MPLLSKVSIALLLGIALTLIGCGGSSNNPIANPNPNNLTQAQAQRLGGEAYADVDTALADALAGSPITNARRNILAALRKNNQVVSASTAITCNSSDTSCTVSYTYQCPDGGSIAVAGSLTETSSTSASGTITETPASCSDGTLVINGDPDVTMGIQGNDNGTTTTVNVTIGGGVSFSPVQTGQFPTGSCTSNLTASASVNDNTGALTCSVGGSICGYAINVSCPPGSVL